MGGLIETLFLDNCNQFADLVRTGDLDFFLLKPIDEQFLISCRHIDWSCALNFLLGVAIMLISLWTLDWQFNLGQASVRAVVLQRGGAGVRLSVAAHVGIGLADAQSKPVRDLV